MPAVGTNKTTVEQDYTPILRGWDGARHRTFVVNPIDTTSVATINQTLNMVTTDQFWRYGRSQRELYLPDGTTCTYEEYPVGTHERRLKRCIGPHGSEELSIEWGAPTTITQVIGGQKRIVSVTFQLGLPTELTFLGRTWTYEWGNPIRVIPPAGPAWEFTPRGSSLPGTFVVKTPQGGEIRYLLDEHPYALWATTPQGHTVVVAKRSTVNSGETLPNDWVYTYNADYSTTVDTPSGAQLFYKHDAEARLLRKEVRLQQGEQWVPIEEEERTYTDLPVVQHLIENGVTTHRKTPALGWLRVTRDGRTYSTTYEYKDDPYRENEPCNGDGHRYGDFHHPWRITEVARREDAVVLTHRVTERTYKHCDAYGGPLNVAHLSKEQVTINGETSVREWDVYSSTGVITSQTIDGVKTDFSSHYLGQPGLVTDANHNTTTIQYDWGIPSVIVTPKHRLEREIRPDGTIKAETQGDATPNARRTEFDYDEAFRLVKVRPPGGGRETTIEYNPAGMWTQSTRGKSKLKTTVDDFGRPIKTENAFGVTVITKYDAEGRKTFEGYPVAPDAEPIGTEIAYDALGRMIKRTNPDTTFSSITYGPGTVTTRDENDNVTVRHVEAFGDPDDTRLVKLTDAKGKDWLYEYNVLGKLTKVTAPDGKQRSWTYETAAGSTTSRVKTETHPESGTTTYTYDAGGNLKTKADAKGQTLTFDYDDNNRVERITANAGTPGEEVTTIGYEPGSDNRASITVGPMSMTYLYDRAGRQDGYIAVIDGRRFDGRFAFDADDNVRTITYPTLRRVSYEYDDENRVKTVRDVLSGVAYASNISYHTSGAVTGYTAGNNIAFSFDYHPSRYWPTRIHSGPLDLSYGDYDGVGNVRAIDDARGSSWGQTFQYDALDRLTVSNGPYGSMAYDYDDHGNMNSMGADVFTYNPTTLRMATRNGQTIAYDDNGSVTSDAQGIYTYTPKNQMATATVNGTTTDYTYDADEWRVKKSSPEGTTYYLRGPNGQVLTEVTITGCAEHTRDYIYAGSSMIAVVER